MKTSDYIKFGSPFSLAFNVSLLSQAEKLPQAAKVDLQACSDTELLMLSLSIRGEALKRDLPFEDMQTALVGYLRTTAELNLSEVEAIVEELKD